MSMLMMARRSAMVSGGGAFYSDGFESGTLPTSGAVAWSSGGSAQATIVNSNAFGGTNSLESIYAVTGNEEDPERRIAYADVGQLRVHYKLKVASGFTHQTGQYKFCMFWGGTYGSQQPGFQWGGEVWRVDASTSRFRPLGTSPTAGAPFGNGEFVYGVDDFGGTYPNGDTFISASGPVIPGTYADIKFDVKPATSATAYDGYYKMWVNDVLFYSITSFNLYSKNVAPLTTPEVNQGFFMGYKNNALTAETRFYMDDLKMYSVDPGWGL